MTIATIAQKLNMPIKVLEKESIKSFLNRELHLAEIELFNLSVKYGAKSIKDFQQKIKKGEVHETRESVEDFFNFDHQEAKKDKLKKILQNI
ncbi:MAG: hypothetical protein Q7R99_03065 [bacterium]|nr:hypothetical protein [bacterium]